MILSKIKFEYQWATICFQKNKIMQCSNLVAKFSGATALIAKFMGPLCCLPGVDSTQVGPVSGGINGIEYMGFQLPVKWTSRQDRQDKGAFVFFRSNAANKGRHPVATVV